MNQLPLIEPNLDDWLEIGTIVAPQGLQGELRVSASSDFPERFEQPGQRWLQSPQGKVQAVELLSGRYVPGKNMYVVQLAGVEDRAEADELRRYKLLVAKSDRPQLTEDEYLVSDLVDLEVYNQLTGETIGVVIDVYWAGHDLLEVKLHQQPAFIPPSEPVQHPSSRKRASKPKQQKPVTVLIPFVNEIVPVVDLEGKRLEITPPPGLLEVNQS